MSAAEHDRHRDDVGAYLLGALPDDEAARLRAHLETCHVCRDELEQLRPAVDALPRSVAQFEPPPSLKAALMETVEAEARRPARRHAPGRLAGWRGLYTSVRAWRGSPRRSCSPCGRCRLRRGAAGLRRSAGRRSRRPSTSPASAAARRP